MKKLVVIINGKGGVGKDTLCDFAGKYFKTKNVSAITPIKEIARQYGGWNGEKDSASRKFLADLKQLFVDYNDLPFKYLCDEYDVFMKSKAEIMFVHIREGKEIQKFKEWVKTPCITLLVERSKVGKINWGNASDDNVNNYKYDYIYQNNKKLSEAEKDFCEFLNEILKNVFKEEVKNRRHGENKFLFLIQNFWGQYFLRTRRNIYR